MLLIIAEYRSRL